MAGNTENYTLTTDFNVNPYYDDYDPDKEFYRILFKPGFAVQARELTQMQTMQTRQIDRFAEHIFKEGSLVSGGMFSIETEFAYVKIKDNNAANSASVNVNLWSNTHVTGGTTGTKARVINVATGSELAANTKTLFVRYTSSGTSGTDKTFANNEVLTSNVGTARVITSNTSIGYGSLFTIEKGVVFSKDHFVSFPRQSIILERYNSEPTCKVGFSIVEEIVNSTTDNTLLDPASGAYNYAAPGADRLKLTAVLTKVAIDDDVGPPDFVDLFIIKDGIVQEKYERTQYSLVRDELARRTFDESGDYFVSGLDVRIREHLDDGENQGMNLFENGGNSSFLVAGVEPGVAYIKGYDIETLVTKYVTIPKGIDYEHVNSQVLRAGLGSYVDVNEFVGSWDMNSGSKVWLYDTAMDRLSTKKWSTGAQTGSVLGNAKIKGVEHISGSQGTPDAVYRVYLMDVNMTNGAFSSVRNLYLNNASTADLGADIVVDPLYGNNAILQETTFNTLVFPIATGFARSIKDDSDNPDTTFTFSKSYPISIASTGVFTIDTSLSDEVFPYGVGFLNTAEKSELLISLDATNFKTMGGTVSTFSNTTVTGSSTFFTRLNVGDKVTFTGVSGTYFISQIIGDTSMKVTGNVASSAAGVAWQKVYQVGDLIDFSVKGADAGTTRTVEMTSSTILEFDMKETLNATISATATVQLNKTTAREIAKVLRPSRLVIINCSTAGVGGPYRLGFSDLYKINSIRKKTGAFSSVSEGVDVTSQFIIDTGQRDEFYDHAFITPISNLEATDYLLINLDYFEPDFTQGTSYFSVDSYPINDSDPAETTTIVTQEIPLFVSPTSGTFYDLRNCLDFRPIKNNTAADATVIGSATSNPADTVAFDAPSGGLRLPVPNSTVTFDYSHYLGRKDLVIMDSLGTVSVVPGNPSVVPITPATPATAMALAVLSITPYPSLSAANADLYGRVDLACKVKKTAYIRHTMRDIGVLKSRIENLEYYASLSLLEKSAQDMSILDADGLDRFKNGIFVDTFSDHSLGALNNPDYKISVDKNEKSIRPIFEMENIMYDYLGGTNVQQSNNLITLEYTEVAYLTQPTATTFRNIDNNIYRFIGSLTLIPETDVWVDTVQKPDLQVQIDSGADELMDRVGPMSTEWGSWQTVVTGYKVYNATTGALVDTYVGSDAAARAQQLASQVNTNRRIELYTDQVRTGSQTFVGERPVSTTLGNKVIDASLIPYIRPQIIKLKIENLKADTKLFTYMDNEPMSGFITPCTSAYVATGAEGSIWKTDADGKAWALLRLPLTSPRFRVGTKQVRVSDSPTNFDDTTTYATAYFVAHGLLQQKQNTILSTTQVIVNHNSLSETRTNRQTFNTPTREPPSPPPNNPPPRPRPPSSGGDSGGRDTRSGTGGAYGNSCLGYTFFVHAPQDEPGIFLTSADLFFAAKDQDYGVWVELKEVNNAGTITTTTLPYSISYLTVDQINTSDDSSVATRVYFRAPIFLVNNTEYAIVIHHTVPNPDTYLWISQLGDPDVLTDTRVVSRLHTGNLFDSNNNMDWTPAPNADLKVVLYRASFVTNTTGTANFGNEPVELFELTSVSNPLHFTGETFRGENRLTLGSISGGTIVTTDRLVGGTSSANGAVTDVSGSVYRVRSEDIETYTSGESVTAYYANGVAKGVTALITSLEYPSASLYRYTEPVSNTFYVQFRTSTGEFETTEQIIGELSANSAIVDAFLPIKYSVVDFEPSYLSFHNTDIYFTMKGTSNTNVVDTTGTRMNLNDNNTFYTEKVLLGRSEEQTEIAGARSHQVVASMLSYSEYVSPVIDILRTNSVLIHNIINNDTDGEDEASGGNLINKYITKTVTLAEGQDAEDMKIYLTAYKPSGTNIHLYVKFLHNEDADLFADREWMELELSSANLTSSLGNIDDFVELEYSIPDAMMTGLFGAVEYTNSAGVDFSGFKQFAVKIGLSSTNSAIVPRVADLRVLAVQM